MLKKLRYVLLLTVILLTSMAVNAPVLNASAEKKTQTVIEPRAAEVMKQYLDIQREKEAEASITISFAGDCTIGTDPAFQYVHSFPWRFREEKNDYAYFFRKVKPVFEADDLTLVNLETTLTTSNKAADKSFRFKGDPAYVNILKAGGIEMVNISNNHIHDYLEQGFNDTLKTLRKGGILYSGEGHIAYYSVKGVNIASIGYTGWNTLIKESLRSDIMEARKKSDIVIVSFHWGEERVFYPDSVQTALGRFCIDQGADVVVGHHPHVVQGIEQYKGKYIVYSLGNFCFGGNLNPQDKDCFIFQDKFVLKGKNIIAGEGKIIPCSISSRDNINDYQPAILEGENGRRVLERIYQYSSRLDYGIKRDECIVK